ncbi:MAG: glycosyltransferase [Planctomycetota bacterium]
MPPHAEPPESENDAIPAGGRLRWIGRGVWALADQALFAGANFLLTVALAIWLDERQFGAFTTAYASFLLVGVFTTALLTEPMMVFGSQKRPRALPGYLGRLLGLHLIVTGVGGLALAAAAVWFLLGREPMLGLALACLAVTQVSQLLPWMTRNACYIGGDPRPAALGGLAYLVLILGGLYTLQRFSALTFVDAIFVMGAASLLVNVYLLVYLRVDLRQVGRALRDRRSLADHWRYGKWALPTGLTNYVPTQLPFVAVPFVLGWAAGTAPDLTAGGALKAMMNFAVPLILIGWALSTLVVPVLVRSRHSPRFLKVSLIMLAVTAGLPLLCWPLLGLFGEALVGWVYRGKFVEHAPLLWLVGLVPVFAGIDATLHSQLKAAERPDRMFFAGVLAAAVLLLAGLPLTLIFGLGGAVAAIALCYATQGAALLLLGGRIVARQCRPLPALITDDAPAAAGADAAMPLPPLPEGPLVSVLMANYNYGHLIETAIRSVRTQTYEHWELVVVDDGSTDGSADVVRRLAEQDARVRLLELPDNRGQGGAWNAGFPYCRGDVLALLDADDAFEPDKLRRVVEGFTLDPRVGMLQHPLQVVDLRGTPVQVIPFLSGLESGWLAPKLLRRGGRWSFMPTSALAFRMQVARRLLPLDARAFRRNADALLFTVAPMLTRVGVLPAPLAQYRVHGENMMSSGRTDRADLRKRIHSFHQSIKGANRHLATLGLDLPPLRPVDHVLYRENLFALTMLRGRRRDWPVRLAGVLGAVWGDDMYGPAQKLLAVPLYGALPMLPPAWRGPWMDHARDFGAAKRIVQSALSRVRRRPAPGLASADDPPLAAAAFAAAAPGGAGGPDQP